MSRCKLQTLRPVAEGVRWAQIGDIAGRLLAEIKPVPRAPGVVAPERSARPIAKAA